jgi:hypothetical protein
MANQLVGLSFNLCIQDVLRGKIAEEDVIAIVASTAAYNFEEWGEYVIKHSKRLYWYDDPERAEAIAWRFIHSKKVIQPRVGDSLGDDLEGYVPLTALGWVDQLNFGANWIDPRTKEPRHL